MRPPTHSAQTLNIPPQPKHRPHFHHVPPGLVNPKPNPLTHSPPTTPTTPRAKHIHMSHTTLISSTSPALDKTPDPRIPPIYALTATTPALPSPSHLTFSQHTHTHHKQYMHHSHCNYRSHNIGYHDNLTDRPKTTTGLQTPHKYTDPAVKVR